MTPHRITNPERTPADRFDDFLQSRGMRNTQQRRALLRLVFDQAESFDADQLLERIPPKGTPDHVSRPTVYRTLAEFVDAGLLRKFEMDGRSIYQFDRGPGQNNHLVCDACRKWIPFSSPEVAELVRKVAADHQFQMSGHGLIISGTCPECRQLRRRPKRRVDLI